MAKRIASSSVDWALLNKYIYPEMKPQLMQLKMKSDKFFKRVSALPPELPKIDWAAYKSKITKPGMVEGFQKNYESLQVPYPGDSGMIASLDKLEGDRLKQHREELKTVKKNIQELEEKIVQLSKMKPISEMTQDEFQYLFPKAQDFYNELFPVGVGKNTKEDPKAGSH